MTTAKPITWILIASLTAAGPAVAQEAVSLDFLSGHWTLYDAEGTTVGTSSIELQVPGAALYESRRVGTGSGQPLWFFNSESKAGWTQLFVGVTRLVREFTPQSPPGQWPLVMGSKITLQDGRTMLFRMTLTHDSDDASHRVLEQSPDGGTTWSTYFDYTYRRSGPRE